MRLAQLNFLFPDRKEKPKSAPRKEIRPIDQELSTWCKTSAQMHNLPELAAKIEVVWNPRMRTTAGRAWWPACRIELNPKLREISEEEIWRTLKHELAHLIAYHRAGRKRIQPHGIEWKIACADLGIPGENTRHTLPFKGRKQKRHYAYTCPACSKKIERVRPFKRDVACFSCCKSKNGGQFSHKFRLQKSIL